MASKVLYAVLLIGLGGLGGYLLASNPQVMNYFHFQRPTTQRPQTDELQPRLDQEMRYRLQERCADRTKTFYEEEYASRSQMLNRADTGGTYVVSYKSHYNTRLNACFILEQIKFLNNETKETSINSMEVVDVNTRQGYAFYGGSTCSVRGTTCKSELEWWQLVKPYIGELASF